MIGAANRFTQATFGGVVVGTANTINGYGTSVSGGAGNTAFFYGASVSGGFSNTAADDCASVSAGRFNTASSPFSSVSGGQGNIATLSTGHFGFGASVSGGTGNRASGTNASVCGGEGNTAFDNSSTVTGGSGNTAGSFVTFQGGSGATVSGGTGNNAAGPLTCSTSRIHTPIGGSVRAGGRRRPTPATPSCTASRRAFRPEDWLQCHCVYGIDNRLDRTCPLREGARSRRWISRRTFVRPTGSCSCDQGRGAVPRTATTLPPHAHLDLRTAALVPSPIEVAVLPPVFSSSRRPRSARATRRVARPAERIRAARPRRSAPARVRTLTPPQQLRSRRARGRSRGAGSRRCPRRS